MYPFGKTYSCLKSPFRKQIEKSMISASFVAPFCHKSHHFSTSFCDKMFDAFCLHFGGRLIQLQNSGNSGLLFRVVPCRIKNKFLGKLGLGQHLGVPSLVFGLMLVSCLIVLGVNFETVCWFVVSAASKNKHPFDLDLPISLGCGGRAPRIQLIGFGISFGYNFSICLKAKPKKH